MVMPVQCPKTSRQDDGGEKEEIKYSATAAEILPRTRTYSVNPPRLNHAAAPAGRSNAQLPHTLPGTVTDSMVAKATSLEEINLTIVLAWRTNHRAPILKTETRNFSLPSEFCRLSSEALFKPPC